MFPSVILILVASAAVAGEHSEQSNEARLLAGQLQRVIYHGDREAAVKLLDRRAPLRLPNGQSALAVAAYRGWPALCDLLLQRGAAEDLERTAVVGNVKGTPLVFAALALEEHTRRLAGEDGGDASTQRGVPDHCETLRVLADAGADLLSTDGRGRTAVMISAASRSLCGIQVLMQRGMAPLLAKGGEGPFRGGTAAHMLADTPKWYMQMCTLLLRRGRKGGRLPDVGIRVPPDWAAEGDTRTCGRVGEALWTAVCEAVSEAVDNFLRAVRELHGDDGVRSIVGLRNALQQTPLHTAAGNGDVHTVEVLLRWGGDPVAQDTFARTPHHMASMANASGALQALFSAHPSPPADSFGRSVADVGLSHPSPVPEAASTNLSTESFMRDYVSLNRPVLIRGGCQDWPCTSWTPKTFAEVGSVEVTAADIPYPMQYGQPHTKLTLRQFVEDHLSTRHDSPPLYVFDNELHRDRQKTWIRDLRVPSVIRGKKRNPVQWSLGGERSGSPPHLHQDAINAVCFGRKVWWLWHPSSSFISIVPASDLFGGAVKVPPAVECEQLPGDLMYVPSGWGHAVLNTEPTAAAASEFYL